MPTQNIFVTKTENKFLPMIQAFTDYLSKYREEQMNIADKMHQLQRKEQLQQYGGDLQKRFAGAKTQEELVALTGETLGETLEAGYNELIPMIGQYSSIYGRGMQMEQQRRGGKATLESFDNNQKVFFGNKMMTIGEVKQNLASQFGEGNEPMLAEVISKLPKAETKELITRDANTNKIIYSAGIPDPSGNWLNVENRDVLKSGQTPYIEKNNTAGMQDDERLNPLMMQQYSTAMFQQKQAEDQEYSRYLQNASLKMREEELSLANLTQLETGIWRGETKFYEQAFMEELAEKRGTSNGTEYLPGGENYTSIRAKYFTGKDLDQPSEKMSTYVQTHFANDPEYQLIQSTQQQVTRLKYAFNKNYGTKKYQLMERDFLDSNSDVDEINRFKYEYTPEEQVNSVIEYSKRKKK